jgi:hypothetical protein
MKLRLHFGQYFSILILFLLANNIWADATGTAQSHKGNGTLCSIDPRHRREFELVPIQGAPLRWAVLPVRPKRFPMSSKHEVTIYPFWIAKEVTWDEHDIRLQFRH